jgi:hypothetical protein
MSRSRFALVFAGIAVLAACSKSPTAPTAVVLPSGEYALQTVNGQPLPYRHIDGRVVLAESFFILNDGRYTQSSTFCRSSTIEDCTPSRAETIDDIAGTYVVNGTEISFSEETHAQLKFVGTVSNDGRRLDLDINHPVRGHTQRVYVRP